MVKHIKDDQIQLMISRAEIQSVTIQKSGEISASVGLLVGDKQLTTVQLSNDRWSLDTPRYLHVDDKANALRDKLFKIIKEGAVISLENIQVALPGEVIEAEDA